MKISLAVIPALLAAASVLAAQTEVPPFHLPAGVELKSDLVYARVGSRALHLDLYLPKGAAAPVPAVVYIHGGGWSSGNKTNFRRQAAYMATKGFAGACIEYRLSGEAHYPAALYDSKAAVRWVRANAQKFGIDPNRIGAAGGSAGGQLVALLGVTNDVPEFEGHEGVTGVSSRVAAVVAINPAADLADFGKRNPSSASNPVFRYLGATYTENPSLWISASPTDHVNSKSVPFLFMHGDADTTVPYRQSVEMMNKLKAAGVRAELFTATGAKHGFYHRPPWFQPCIEHMESFFASTLGK